MLPVARRLTAALDLPDDVPTYCDSLQLTEYFMDDEKPEPGGELQTARRQEDPGTASYVAVYLRAAEHAIRLNCPVFYT